ncbi:hypothetical protein [Novilysobacter erysipheiresistens]|uniref:Uncharacterized protein n=1 Tax=Novilysobacter erysipheiresistens TaxID=1749332 RepID=A0ABU7YUB0_9GAMM
MEQMLEQFGGMATMLFAESLGKVVVLMLPIGLIYGKLFRRYRWAALLLAIPFAALLDIAGTAAVDDVNPLLIGAVACIAAIEAASLVFKSSPAPEKAP